MFYTDIRFPFNIPINCVPSVTPLITQRKIARSEIQRDMYKIRRKIHFDGQGLVGIIVFLKKLSTAKLILSLHAFSIKRFRLWEILV